MMIISLVDLDTGEEHLSLQRTPKSIRRRWEHEAVEERECLKADILVAQVKEIKLETKW